jgi:hypothetical protein
MGENYWLAKELLASQEGLCSMELITLLISYLVTIICEFTKSTTVNLRYTACLYIVSVHKLYNVQILS